jgi:large subunit ribosomal protein L4
MAAPKAPLLDVSGKKAKDVSLEESIFGAEVKPHLVHETVRAELNDDRAGTRGGKSRGLVAGGRAKPWRQKGTGRARAGTIRAPQFTGGGIAFPPNNRNFEVKVNKKARHAALRSALSDHAAHGTIAIVGSDAFGEPSTKQAVSLLEAWQQELPLLVIAREDEETLIKSFRNLPKTVVTVPSELEVSQVVWARAVLVSEGALGDVQGRAA